MPSADPRWYETFFEGEWLDYLALRDPELTRQQGAFIVEKLGLEPGAHILDLACGRGRIAIELARRGFEVTGLDLSRRSLELAASAAAEAGVELSLVHRDMRELDDVAVFAGVVNVFTSFGYFEREEDDRRVLANVARALKPAGRFLLDTLNPIAVAAQFVPEQRHEFEDGTVVVEHRRYDDLRGRHDALWTFTHTDGSRCEFRTSLRTYTAAELVRMLAEAGLEVDEAWGGFDGAPLGQGTRTILLARREDP